ncbi:MAG: serine/threonine protein kinase [Chitinispirillaceae bacterium]|nr:serine/threonine protein kinase [Chitinispirillaceae bacterium]
MDDQTDFSGSEQNKKWIKTISDLSLADLKPKCVPGEKIGSGSVVELIGEGGMARVFKIWNEDLEMPRAVKIMLPSEKKEVADRFVTEARLTARLNHPNIVLVFGVGEWNGYHFIEMEYIDGYPLDKLLTQRKYFPAYVSCAICILITRALCYAHSQKFTLYNKEYVGIIHRDLKPGNVMLHRDGRLKLMDFGIARPIKTGFHTMNDNIVGTLQYLSPEQLNNKGVDQRTDIYAVGAILYELLCGIKAFPDGGLTDLVNKKAEGIYKQVDEFSVAVPAKISEIVDTCLQVRPEDRYLNAAALLDALTHAYEQCTSEQMESALKNFLDDPEYVPALPQMDKNALQRKSSQKSVKGSVNSTSTLRFVRRPVFITVFILAIVFSTILTFLVVSKKCSIGSVSLANANVSVLSNDSESVPADSFSAENSTDTNASIIGQNVSDQSLQSQIQPSLGDSAENDVTEKTAYVDTLKTVPSASSIIDQCEVAVKVLQDGSLADAYTEINKIEPGDPRKIDLLMDLVEKYIDKSDIEHARKLVFSIASDAARVHLLRGRVFYKKKEPERALNELESAMFASTGNKNARTLKCEILFYQACCYELIYNKNKLAEHRQPAIRFWKQVQKYYAATPDHPRYILATEKIQNL